MVASLLFSSLCLASSFAVSTMPEAEWDDTEVVTNAALPAARADSRVFGFSLELDGTASNNVEVAFGRDVDHDGMLSRAEADLLVGWDCGEWKVVGYFLDPSRTNWLDHARWGADNWNAVAVGLQDMAGIDECAPPWQGGGSFSWPIPNHWGVRNTHTPSGYFCNTDQTFEIDADGTTRIRKFGYVGECTTNRVVTIHKEMQP
jgi:hypothetical protein